MAQRYWNRFSREGAAGQVLPPGEDLAAFRSGVGREALTVPKMWPFYTITPDESAHLERFGAASAGQQAEHAALALFGVHQQSQKTLMHMPGIGLGSALRVLRGHEKYSADAVDRRVSAMVSATSVSMLTYRLRGLVTQLRDIKQPLDYDRLLRDLEHWPWPDRRQRVRTAWAQGYQRWEKPAETTTD
ncbi:type I-E CRISPR-associated protein Cse2/CasB [Nocardia sp. NPDC059180]|uniref:type I-E CRISPR-associated protein Cse2/CasB n=1 Tax=Nocardia sp. NPDC059180 TaxID=3346761 RepID=UPI0036BDA876